MFLKLKQDYLLLYYQFGEILLLTYYNLFQEIHQEVCGEREHHHVNPLGLKGQESGLGRELPHSGSALKRIVRAHKRNAAEFEQLTRAVLTIECYHFVEVYVIVENL